MNTASDENYEDLANGIVAQVVKDYRSALRRLKRNPQDNTALYVKNTVERFRRGVGGRLTEKELNQLFFLNKECERLQRDIRDKKTRVGYKSPIMSDMPRGCGKDYTDDIDEIADLETIMTLNLKQIQRERARLEEYIGVIEDAEIRLIYRLHHINCMTFTNIGLELNMDRRTVSRKYYRYLKKLPAMPDNNMLSCN